MNRNFFMSPKKSHIPEDKISLYIGYNISNYCLHHFNGNISTINVVMWQIKLYIS